MEQYVASVFRVEGKSKKGIGMRTIGIHNCASHCLKLSSNCCLHLYSSQRVSVRDAATSIGGDAKRTANKTNNNRKLTMEVCRKLYLLGNRPRCQCRLSGYYSSCGCLLSRSFRVWHILCPEDRSNTFLHTVEWSSLGYKTLIVEDKIHRKHRSEKLRLCWGRPSMSYNLVQNYSTNHCQESLYVNHLGT